MIALIKVGLLGLAEDYDKSKGQGIQRYMHEVYFRMKLNRKNIQIEKTGNSHIVPVIGAGLSFLLGNMAFDFGNYDIIHNMDQKPLLPLRKDNAILVTTVHDFQPLLAPYLNDIGPKERLWQAIINYGMWKSLESDYLIARSTLTKADAIKLGYDRSKITIISDGVDERYFSRSRRMKRKDFVVGYLGAFRKRKNIGFAINSFRHINTKNITFEIYGKEEFEYKKVISASTKDGRIKYMGFAPENKIVQIYDSFDAFVFPSLYEGFGIPIIEAQARGLPVIICKHGKIPKEVRKYCFEADDEEHMARIIESLKENGYNERIRKKATEYARSFTWARESTETLKLYKIIMG